MEQFKFNNKDINDLYFNEIKINNEYIKSDSKFSDDIWNINNSSLDFTSYKSLNSKFLLDFKIVMFHFILKEYKKYKIDSIFNKTSKIFDFFFHSQELGYSSITDLSDPVNFIQVLEQMKDKFTYGTLNLKIITLRAISELDIPELNFELPLNKKGLKNINGTFLIEDLSLKYSLNKTASYNQTLYIPKRIFSELIQHSLDIINKEEKNIETYLNFLEEDYLNYEEHIRNLPEKISHINKKAKMDKLSIQRTKDNRELLAKYNIEYTNNAEISKILNRLCLASSFLILAFTGMRSNELYNIKQNSFHKIKTSSHMLYFIRTYETKISGGSNVDFITSPICENAMNIIDKIHSLARKYENDTSGYIFSISKHQKIPSFSDITRHFNLLVEDFDIRINEEDLRDSVLLNGHCEEVKVGKYWPIKGHQLRRTLIVNFVSHMNIDINSVKQQVKHMYATMTEYYAKNSQLAKVLNMKQADDITKDIDEELINENVRQHKKLYYEEPILEGVKGKEIIQQRSATSVLTDLELKNIYKKGLLKLTRSTFGYCTKGENCDKNEVVDPTFCGARCDTMIITLQNALEWQKMYNRNRKLMNNKHLLMVDGLSIDGTETLLQSQMEVAKKIMKSFNLEYEE